MFSITCGGWLRRESVIVSSRGWRRFCTSRGCHSFYIANRGSQGWSSISQTGAGTNCGNCLPGSLRRTSKGKNGLPGGSWFGSGSNFGYQAPAGTHQSPRHPTSNRGGDEATPRRARPVATRRERMKAQPRCQASVKPAFPTRRSPQWVSISLQRVTLASPMIDGWNSITARR